MLKTLTLALDVLKMFTREKPTWGGRELASKLGLNHARIYRVLETLAKNNFLYKDPETKKYSLGFALWELGNIMYEGLNVEELIRPSLEELRRLTGESIFLTVLDEDEAVTLEVIEPENKVKFSVSTGSRAPLYVGASYRSILAYLTEEKINDILQEDKLKSYTANTMINPMEIIEELEKIRTKGWAISEGEYTADVIAIAVPLFKNDKIIGSITVSGPIYRMTDDKIETYLPLLMDTRDNIAHTIERYQLSLHV